MAKAPSMRPRTKYLNTKYHWFRSLINNVVEIEYIKTTEQIADFLTKPNPPEVFIKHRKAMMGW